MQIIWDPVNMPIQLSGSKEGSRFYLSSEVIGYAEASLKAFWQPLGPIVPRSNRILVTYVQEVVK